MEKTIVQKFLVASVYIKEKLFTHHLPFQIFSCQRYFLDSSLQLPLLLVMLYTPGPNPALRMNFLFLGVSLPLTWLQPGTSAEPVS